MLSRFCFAALFATLLCAPASAEPHLYTTAHPAMGTTYTLYL